MLASPSLLTTSHPAKGRGQGHVGNFCILDLENFATASLRCIGVNRVINSSTVSVWITPTTVERVMAEYISLLYVGRL